MVTKTLALKLPLLETAESEHQLSWWIKIKATVPAYTYWFGPFESQHEATCYQNSYLDDLQADHEDAFVDSVQKCYPPDSLTIFEGQSNGLH